MTNRKGSAVVTTPEIVARLVKISDDMQEVFDTEGDRHYGLEQAQAAVDELTDELRHV